MSGPRVVRVFFGWLFVLVATSCSAQPTPLPLPTPIPTIDILTIGISDSATELAQLVERAYLNVAPHMRLNFVPGNDQVLQSDLESRYLDALLVHHFDGGTTTWFNPVAVDGLMLMVHPDIPLAELSLAEVRAIFTGQLINWSLVGGPDLPIELFIREDGSGAANIFLDRVMSGQKALIHARVAPNDNLMHELVNTTNGSIGYTMMGNINKANYIAVNGIIATPTTTADQSYPLASPIYFVSLSEPQGPLRAFLAWLQSTEGQMIVGDSYGRVR